MRNDGSVGRGGGGLFAGLMAFAWRRSAIGLVLLALVFAVWGTGSSWGRLIDRTDEDIVSETDLGVEGILRIQRFRTDGRLVLTVGTIEVTKVYFGAVKVGDRVDVRWVFDAHWMDSRDYSHMEGTTAPWLLQQMGDNGIYTVTHWSNFRGRSASDIPRLVSPIRVIANQESAEALLISDFEKMDEPEWTRGKRVPLKVVFRNTTTGTLEVPNLTLSGSEILAPPNVNLAMYEGDKNRVYTTSTTDLKRVSGRIVRRDTAPDVTAGETSGAATLTDTTRTAMYRTLQPGQRVEFAFDGADYFSFPTDEVYTFVVTSGTLSSNWVRVYVQATDWRDVSDWHGDSDSEWYWPLIVRWQYDRWRLLTTIGVVLGLWAAVAFRRKLGAFLTSLKRGNPGDG